MVPVPYSDRMESLESCFFADSSDFVAGSVNRSRSPDAADKEAAAGLVEALWEIKVKTDYCMKAAKDVTLNIYGTSSLLNQMKTSSRTGINCQ